MTLKRPRGLPDLEVIFISPPSILTILEHLRAYFTTPYCTIMTYYNYISNRFFNSRNFQYFDLDRTALKNRHSQVNH